MSKPVFHRYFFAALPDPVGARRIRAWAERMLGAEGLQDAGRLHATLAITEDFPSPQPELAAALRRAGSDVRAAPFDLVLDRLSVGGSSIALRPGRAIPDLKALNVAIVQAMGRENIALRPNWRFSPHMTLVYRPSAPRTQAVRDRGWPVREFVLVHSFYGLTRHDILGRWPLEPLPDAQLSLFAA